MTNEINNIKISRSQLLAKFFKELNQYLSTFTIECIDSKMNANKLGLAVVSDELCDKWFIEGAGTSKTEMFGSYFDFGDGNYLLHIAVAASNMYFGFVKYRLNDGQYETAKINNKDFTYTIQKFTKDLPEHLKLDRKGWGNVWSAFDGGNFRIMSSSDMSKLITQFADSKLCLEHFAPVLNRLNEIKRGINPSYSFVPTSLVFRVSYKCNIECKHCYNSSNGKERDYIDKEAALKVIKESFECGVRSMGLTGGEAMLFPDLVFAMVTEAANLGYEKMNIVTNAYWGKTLASARKKLKKFYNAGFKPPVASIAISAGEFHREFLDWTCHKNVIKANSEIMGTKIRVDFEHSVGNDQIVDEFKNYLKSEGIEDDWYNLVVRKSLANVGRWKENQDNYNSDLIAVEDLGSCEPVSMLTIEPNGDVFPCCGFNRQIKGLVLGNVHESSIADIIVATETHTALQLLYHKHMHEIQKQLSQHVELPNKFSSLCEACECFFKDKQNIELLSMSSSAQD